MKTLIAIAVIATVCLSIRSAPPTLEIQATGPNTARITMRRDPEDTTTFYVVQSNTNMLSTNGWKTAYTVARYAWVAEFIVTNNTGQQLFYRAFGSPLVTQ